MQGIENDIRKVIRFANESSMAISPGMIKLFHKHNRQSKREHSRRVLEAQKKAIDDFFDGHGELEGHNWIISHKDLSAEFTRINKEIDKLRDK